MTMTADVQAEPAKEAASPQAITAAMLLHLRSIGVDDPRLAKAVEVVPLSDFVPAAQKNALHLDRWIPIDCGQAIEPVGVLLAILDAARLDADSAVLEIGTGSGYLTAIMSTLSRKVVSLERYATLAEQARARLQALNIPNAVVTQQDGRSGCPDQLFDRIVVHGRFDKPPRVFLEQLAAGGMLVCSLGAEGEEAMLVRLTKIGSRYDRQDLFPWQALPLERGLPLAL